MSYFIHRFDVRFVVFSPEDVHLGLRAIETQIKSADVENGDSGIASMKYHRAARWTVSEFNNGSSGPVDGPRKEPHLTPLMFNLTCAFPDREFLRQALAGVHSFFDTQLHGEPIHPGLRGDVPDFNASAPCGEWQISQVEVEWPNFYFGRPIWGN